MLDTFSKDIIYMKLLPPYTQTLFVELVRFTPGQPDSVAGNGPANGFTVPGRTASTPVSSVHPPYQNGSPHPPRAAPSSSGPPSSSNQRPLSPPLPYDRSNSGNGSHGPPPPPWSSRSSRWSSAAATAPPPTARNHPPEVSSPLDSPPSRKRKHQEEGSPNGSLSVTIPSPSTRQPSPKRRPTMPTPITMHTPVSLMSAQSPVAHTPTSHPSIDRKSTRLNSSHSGESRMPSSA